MSRYYVGGIPFNSEDALSHHGILGQKWGIRRYQNRDGSLTEEGRARYASKSEQKKLAKALTVGVPDKYHVARRSLNTDKIRRTPQVRDAVSKLINISQNVNKARDDVANTEFRDFYKDSKVREEYIQLATDKFWKELVLTQKVDPSDFPTRDDALKFMRDYGDEMDDYSPLAIFRNSKDPRAAGIQEAYERLSNLQKEQRRQTKSLVQDYLGEYAYETNGAENYTAAARLEDIINDTANYSQRSLVDKMAYPRKPI